MKLSPAIRPNGLPPRNREYTDLAVKGFRDWTFKIGGLVRNPLNLSYAQVKSLPKKSQTTRHVCVQGWTYYARWGGVPLRFLLQLCKPVPKARYVLFRTFDEKWEDPGHGEFYGTIDLDQVYHPQTLLAYELNGEPLPVPFGAPLRLRVESERGYKMTKWIREIELIEDFKSIGKGQGGWREDRLHYAAKPVI